MKTFMRYLAWNAILVVPLVFGWTVGEQKIPGIIIGTLYAIIVAINITAILASFSDKENKLYALTTTGAYLWKVPFELFFIFITAYMGYKKIASCMVFEFFVFSYLFIESRIKGKPEEKPEEKEEATNEEHAIACRRIINNGGCVGAAVACEPHCVPDGYVRCVNCGKLGGHNGWRCSKSTESARKWLADHGMKE
jgi:hypothetical protein